MFTPSVKTNMIQGSDFTARPSVLPKQQELDQSVTHLSPARIMQLQKTIGNQAVMQLLKSRQVGAVATNSTLQLDTEISNSQAGAFIIADKSNKINSYYKKVKTETKGDWQAILNYPLLKYTLKQANDPLNIKYHAAKV